MMIGNNILGDICSFRMTINTDPGEDPGTDPGDESQDNIFGDIEVDTNDFPISLAGFLSDKPYQTPAYKSLYTVVKCDLTNYVNGILGSDSNIYLMPNFPFKDTNSANGRVLKIDTVYDSVSFMPGSVDAVIAANKETFSNGLRLNEDVIFVPGRTLTKPGTTETPGYLYNLKTNISKMVDHRIDVSGAFYSAGCIKKGTKLYFFNTNTNNLDMAILDMTTEEITTVTGMLPAGTGIKNAVLHPNGLIYAIISPDSATNGIYVIDPETRTVVDSFGKSADIMGEWGACVKPHIHPNGNLYLIKYISSKIHFAVINPTARTTSTSQMAFTPKGTINSNYVTLSTNGYLYFSQTTSYPSPHLTDLVEIDITTGTGKIVHTFTANNAIYNTCIFAHPNGKLYIVPLGTDNNTSAYVYDTKCPTKDPSIFLTDYANSSNWW